jgi:mannose-1-phosphate guanylyltransferase/phosphomannomutase
MIKRAMLSGLVSTGVDVSDLRTMPSAVGRHLLKTQGYEAGFHVGVSPQDPEAVRIQLFEQPGITLTAELQKEVEKHFSRRELRRAAIDQVGSIQYPARARESYAQDLLSILDVDAIHARSFRIVLDYGYSSASYVLPLVLGPLGVEAVTAHGVAGDEALEAPVRLSETIGQTKRLVQAVGADFGAVFDRAAERVYLIDEGGREIAVDQALLLLLRLIADRRSGQGGKIALPVTVTSQAERLVEEAGLEVIRTPASLSELTKAAAGDGVVFGGALGGGYVWPDFLPAYDAMTSLCKLLELLAPVKRPLSELVAELPSPTLVHRQLQCPWALKGLVMRVLNERLADRDVDLTDGIKLYDERGWAQVLPDADEPLVHVYAEGATTDDSEALEAELRGLVEEVMADEEATTRS